MNKRILYIFFMWQLIKINSMQEKINTDNNIFFLSFLEGPITIGVANADSLFSFKQSNIENLNFTGQTIVIGNSEFSTIITINNLKLIDSFANYLMINPDSAQVYAGNENNPGPDPDPGPDPVPDTITVPNVLTDQIVSGNKGLYINNIDFDTVIGNATGTLEINASGLVLNGIMKSHNSNINFSGNLNFVNNVKDIGNMTGASLFFSNGIGVLHAQDIHIIDPVKTTKTSLTLGNLNTSTTVNSFNDICTIDTAVDTVFGDVDNSKIILTDIRNYYDGDLIEVLVYILSDKSIKKVNFINTIKESILQIPESFSLSSLNTDNTQTLDLQSNSIYGSNLVLSGTSSIKIGNLVVSNLLMKDSFPNMKNNLNFGNVIIDKFYMKNNLYFTCNNRSLLKNYIQINSVKHANFLYNIYFDGPVGIQYQNITEGTFNGRMGYSLGICNLFLSTVRESFIDIEKFCININKESSLNKKIEKLEKIYKNLLIIKNEIEKYDKV